MPTGCRRVSFGALLGKEVGLGSGCGAENNRRMALDNRIVFDISPRVSARLGVFPGDRPFEQTVSLSFEQGHHLKLSSVQTTLHLGAHVDAPSHYSPSGCNMDEVDLSRYLGPCEVVTTASVRGRVVTLEDIPPGFRPKTKRVLMRTQSFPDPERWNSDFAGLAPELVDWLADAGVVLIGIDTPSIDPESSKTLDAHGRVAARGLCILEGVVLAQVPDGCYELVALPLAIEGGDASPVRAVLLGH